MPSEVATGEPISQQSYDDLRALTKRGGETGETFAYDPAERRVEVVRTPAAQVPQPFYLGQAPEMRQPIVYAPQRRERPRERRAQRRTSRTSRGAPDDLDPDLAHKYDREVIAAVWRCERAKAGRGYRFELPPSLRATP